MDNAERNNREIEEAIMAGREALQSLNRVDQSLTSAKRIGIRDMLGGGFFPSLIKNSQPPRTD